MAVLYTYVVRYDSGFAPNPFFGFCTLATCKPNIRKHAKIGDWIVGTGSSEINRNGCLVYAMKVTEVLSFEEYSSDARFKKKKPCLYGSYKMAAGDNIYELTADSGIWYQLDSYHSRPNGSPNSKHIQRDTSVNRVLISQAPNFVYFGADGPLIPDDLVKDGVLYSNRGHKKVVDLPVIARFTTWINSLEAEGYQGRPYDMIK